MKKFGLLLLFVVFTLLFSVSISAAEVDTVAETPIETSVETTDVETGEMVELPDGFTKEDLDRYWESFKENLSKLSVWLTAFFSTSGVAIMAFVVKWGIGKVFDKIEKNAHKTDTKIDDKLVANRDEIMACIGGLAEVMTKSFSDLAEKVNTSVNNEDKMFEILTVFIMNSNEPESSKAEMIEMLEGIKVHKGEFIDIVKQAQEDIDKIKREKAALAPPTPALDELVEEKNTYMKLG